MTNASPKQQMENILKAIDFYKDKYTFIFIGTNADTGSDQIRVSIKKYINENKEIIYYENLSPDSYNYLLKNSIALIGNSSSGIIEAPSLGCYTINIGDRQKGRIRAESVFDVKCDELEIKKIINKVIKLDKKEEFNNPYYMENSNEIAYKLTKEILKQNDSKIKEFYDIE